MQHHHHLPTTAPCETSGHPAIARDHGFSLIELIFVIVILGLLTSAVVIAIGGMRADASDSRCAADRRSLAVAAEAYHAEHGTAPIPATGNDRDRFERTLVDSGLLRAASTIHDLDADGVVQPEGTSPC